MKRCIVIFSRRLIDEVRNTCISNVPSSWIRQLPSEGLQQSCNGLHIVALPRYETPQLGTFGRRFFGVVDVVNGGPDHPEPGAEGTPRDSRTSARRTRSMPQLGAVLPEPFASVRLNAEGAVVAGNIRPGAVQLGHAG